MTAGGQIRKIISVLSSRGEEVAAVLVPRVMARALVEEIYPEVEDRSATGISFIDSARADQVERRSKERDSYKELVEKDGYVGSIFGKPMLVVEDCVLCGLTVDELDGVSARFGIDVRKIVGRDGM